MMIKDMIIEFFTGRPDKLGILYVIMGVSLFTYILFSILPEEKAIKFHGGSRLYDWDNEYDAQETVKRSRRFALQLLIYSTLVLILGYVLGHVVIDIGFWLFFPLALVLNVIRGGYVKK